jgi:hypothetical protein
LNPELATGGSSTAMRTIPLCDAELFTFDIPSLRLVACKKILGTGAARCVPYRQHEFTIAASRVVKGAGLRPDFWYGHPDALDRARPVLDTFAKSVFHLGDVRAGATMKLVVNSLGVSLNVAISEALVLAERAGLDREATYEVFESSAVSAPHVKHKREALLRPGDFPVAGLALTAKDQELIHDLAEQTGTRMDQAESGRKLVAEAVAAGLAERDVSEVAEFLRNM